MVLAGTNGVPVGMGVAVIAVPGVSTVRATVVCSGMEGYPIRASQEPITTTATSIAMTNEIRTANDKVGFSFQNYLRSVSAVIT